MPKATSTPTITPHRHRAITHETGWVIQHEIDAGQRYGVSTADAQRIKGLVRENSELGKANEILKLSSAFFVQAELDRRLE